MIFLICDSCPFQVIFFFTVLISKDILHIPIDFATLMSRMPTRYCPIFALLIFFVDFDCAF